MRRLRDIEWHAVAGVIAAVGALVLHLLHVVDETVVLAVILVLLALVIIGNLRGEAKADRIGEAVERSSTRLADLERSLDAPSVALIGPRNLRTQSEAFARRAQGEMTWFNVCLRMFVPQALFDAMLKPAIENPAVPRIQFVIDPKDRHLWDEAVRPKLDACSGSHKVAEPEWREIHEPLSFILAEVGTGAEAHLSFWGEPFMSRSTGRDIPRYVFHVLSGSDLIGHLAELERGYRLGTRAPES